MLTLLILLFVLQEDVVAAKEKNVKAKIDNTASSENLIESAEVRQK